MNHANFIRTFIYLAVAGSVLFAAACGGDSEPSSETGSPDSSSSVSAPAPAAQTSAPAPAPPPAAAPAPAPSETTIDIGHQVGDRAPEFMLALTDDRQINSTELVAEGKPVFILFHATW